MKKRIEWVDMSKGFATILVMIGHLSNVGVPVKAWLYTFHIPLFFFLSGYVFSVEKYVDFKYFIISKVKTLLFPMAVMGLINAIWLFFLEPSNGIKSIIYRFVGCFVELRGSKLDSGLWFIACLFVTEIMYCIILKVAKEKSIVPLLLICSIVGYIYIHIIGHIVPWAVEVALISVGFFGCGHLLKEHKKYIDRLCRLKFLGIFTVTNIGVTYINHQLGTSVDLYANKIGIYPLFYLGAFSGILMSITIFKSVNKLMLLTYLGRNSFVFYAFHVSCFQTLSKILDAMRFNVSYRLEWLVYMLVTIFFVFVIAESINRYAPWILGRFQKKEKSIL